MPNENPKQALMKLVEEWESQDKQAFIEELLELLTENQISRVKNMIIELIFSLRQRS